MFTVQPIAYVKNRRRAIVDDNWESVTSVIELTDAYPPESLYGIEEFSHLEIIYYFDRVTKEQIETGARHPRHQKSYPKVGIFAQRGKNRPNQLGLTTVKLINVQKK